MPQVLVVPAANVSRERLYAQAKSKQKLQKHSYFEILLEFYA